MTEQAGSVLAGNPAAEASAPAAGQPPAAPDWATDFPDDAKSVVTTKGWKSPADVVQSYIHAEKLIGADKAGRAVVPPKDDAPAEEWRAFHAKLGMPEKPDGYNLAVPEGQDATFAQEAAAKFHEIGLPAKQGAAIGEWWNAKVEAIQAAEEQRIAQEATLGMQQLREAWGTQFDAQLELGRRAAREAGFSPELIGVLEKSVLRDLGASGFKELMAGFAKNGQQYAEATIHGTDNQRGGFGPMTPEAAKSRIQALKGDSDWVAKYTNGNPEARAEFDRLHTIAYG